MTYYIYHIPGKKIGMTCDLYNRVTEQQGYEPHEYEVLTTSQDVGFASDMERQLQKEYGYKVDRVPYNKLKCNNMKMKINVTEQTTTFPCPVNKLKGQLMDNIGMEWETDHGDCVLTLKTVEWIMKNVKESMYNDTRSYVYNKAFARFQDNNDIWDFRIDKNGPLDNAYQSHDKLGGNLEEAHMQTRTGALSPTGIRQEILMHEGCDCVSQFDLIRDWADERGLYDNGDPKTQALKLVEEVGETCRAILKEDYEEVTDGIGDCIVVLTNLAELHGVSIEECIEKAYNEIKNRTGKMENGTYKKD